MSQQNVATKCIEPVYTDEDNREMWKCLDKKDKITMFRVAQTKFRYLGDHMRLQGQRLGDDGFVNSSCFNLLMELVGRRRERRIEFPTIAITPPE